MKKVIKEETKKPIRRKCHSCGKMATKPYVYHIVPSYSYGAQIPIYSKNDVKTKRVDLRGNKKVLVYNYCNRECYENKRPQETYEI
jgi:hypothetical protein